MMRYAYIEVTVSLVEALKALSQRAQNRLLDQMLLPQQLCNWEHYRFVKEKTNSDLSNLKPAI